MRPTPRQPATRIVTTAIGMRTEGARGAVAPPNSASRLPRCGTCGRCVRCRRWTEPEDEFVDAMLGEFDLETIAVAVTARFGIGRTATAVGQRLKRRGQSRWVDALSLRALERIFGVDRRTILQGWIGHGLLTGQRHAGRGPPPWLALQDRRTRGLRTR